MLNRTRAITRAAALGLLDFAATERASWPNRPDCGRCGEERTATVQLADTHLCAACAVRFYPALLTKRQSDEESS